MSKNFFYRCIVITLLLIGWLFPKQSIKADDKDAARHGLYVNGGVLMHDGRPYAGIGANYDTLFGRLLQNKDDTSSLENLARLAHNGIPFVRFRACGFWPQNAQLYLTDRSEYFRRMDEVIRCAEKNKIGLIPSLFWRLATVIDLVGGEPAQLGDPGSPANAFIARYTREMVSRYKDSPAIWAWEFGNEANLGVDLPKPGRRQRGGGFVGETDVRLTTTQLATAYASFANVIRSLDPTRAIDTGTSVPRPAAWHNAHGQARVHDTEQQSYSMLLAQNPDPINLLSVHIYSRSQKLDPYGPESVTHFIGRYARAAASAGKPLFIGEFPVRDRRQAETYLQAIRENRVPLSAFWVFDNKKQEANMGVTFDNNRAFVLQMVRDANQAMQQAAPLRP